MDEAGGDPEEAVSASVERIRSLMHDIEAETAALGRAVSGTSMMFQWGAVAAWRSEAELAFAEALAGVGIICTQPEAWREYRGTIAKALACLKGDAAGANYLARWDQVEARALALLELDSV